jgi:hypothetical protein
VEPLGGVAEVEFLGNSDEVAKVAKLHLFLDPAPLRRCGGWSFQG